MVLTRRDGKSATLLEDGREAVYATLAVFDFTSERRRMSALVLTPQARPSPPSPPSLSARAARGPRRRPAATSPARAPSNVHKPPGAARGTRGAWNPARRPRPRPTQMAR